MSCHDGVSGFMWTIAGTLYDKPTGGTAIGGATIEIIDANNQKIDLVTSTNGNFYTTKTVAYPLKVRATDCPNDVHMTASIAKGTDAASCNKSGCHDSAMRIHLP
jgi:hypothetical protein